ncbi:MAG: cohesin domain-containing protein [Saprospiraceae bacterium]
MKSENFTNSTRTLFEKVFKLSMMTVVFTVWYSGVIAQTQPCPLACNSLVQVSMDDDCVVDITPGMMLKDNGVLPTCNYVVQVKNQNGQLITIPGYTGYSHVNGSYVGQTLEVKVWLGNNSCWGMIKLEDKLAPTIDCPSTPEVVTCWDPDYQASAQLATLIATDNCQGTFAATILSDVVTELGCDDDYIAKRVIKYQAKDQYNNISTVCERTIYFSPISIDDIKFPKNYDGTLHNRPHLECDGGYAWNPVNVTNWDTNNSGYPEPSETGGPYIKHNDNILRIVNGYKVSTPTVYGGANLSGCTAGNVVGWEYSLRMVLNSANTLQTWKTVCDGGNGVSAPVDTIYNAFIGTNTLCKINTTYTDTRIDICAESYKVLRYWTVLDWCTGGVRQMHQIIKVVDEKGPVATIPTDVTAPSGACQTKVSSVILADPYSCTGSWSVIEPINVYDCSDWDYSVAFLLADQNGNAPTDGIYVTQDGGTSVSQITDHPTSHKNRYVINGLPLGCTWIRYSVYDECGNVTYAFTEIYVDDKTPPVAVCDEHTVVTLSNNGWAHVFATTFDDGSHDNCSDVSFLVRRMGTSTWGGYVQFDCSDVGKDVTIELQVTDANNNKNTCMVIATTQDKVPPIITCPASVTINCQADTSTTAQGKPVYSTSALSTPYYTDNCPNPKMTWTTSGKLNNCGQGTFTRTFVVTDSGTRSSSCTQIITVKDNNPYAGPTSFPADVTLKGCINIDTKPSKTGEPVLGTKACSQVAYTYEDQLFPFVDGVCYKILRKWTVIDWCKFRDNNDPTTYIWPSIPTEDVNMWTDIQVIKVVDEDKPVIQTTSKADTQVFGADCSGEVVLTNSATDCTPAGELDWTWVVTLQSGGQISGTKNDASGVYPVGTHTISWTVEDHCGNLATKSYPFRVVDAKKPTPYCISELTTVVMPTTGSIAIWAKDFDKGSTDNCPLTGCGLRFTFNGAKPVQSTDHYFDNNGLSTKSRYDQGLAQFWSQKDCSSSMIFTCDDLGSVDLDMSVWDAEGNTDYCTVKLNIQANGTACGGSRIAGHVATEDVKTIENVEVNVMNGNSNEQSVQMTDDKGEFNFASMAENTKYTVTPVKDVDYLDGVSTLDLVLIQRHILGIQSFTSAYKYFAADVNKDNNVSVADLSSLRKVILGIDTKFTNNTSWRFFNKAQQINDITYPWNASESIVINSLNGDNMNNDFVAVKVGDLNGNATGKFNSEIVDSRSGAGVVFVAQDRNYTEGEVVKIDVTSDNFQNIAGAQWTLNFDAKAMQFENVESGILSLEDRIHSTDGKITVSWSETNTVSASKDQVLFTLVFRATSNNTISNTLTLTSDALAAEVYNENLNTLNLQMEFRQGSRNEMVLLQNTPNPFETFTRIEFYLPEAGTASLNVYDVTGRIIKSIKGDFAKGHNEVKISENDLNSSGVFFYELEYLGQKANKKMVFLSK